MRQKWIDCLKAAAMIAVLQNHLPGVARIYDALYSAFAVSLFVILGGGNSGNFIEGKTSFFV